MRIATNDTGIDPYDVRCRRICDSAYSATPIAATIHDCAGVSVPPTMSLMKSFWMRTLPPSLTISSRMPWNSNTLASVTTNDGMPTLATRKPVNAPSNSATPNEATQRRDERPTVRRVAWPTPPPTRRP